MDRALPRHDDAVAAQRDLRDDVRAIVILRAHLADLFFERQFLGDDWSAAKVTGRPVSRLS